MIEELKRETERVENIQETENGANGFRSSGSELVDLNFKVGARHGNVDATDIAKFDRAIGQDPAAAARWLFMLRDVREGMGERLSFEILFSHLWEKDMETARKLITLIPEYGRWKDMIDLMDLTEDKELESLVIEIIGRQLREDMENSVSGKPISLLAKWMPSVNSSGKARAKARKICNALEVTFAAYRKAIAVLRRKLDVTEVKTCGNRWDEIDYGKVSSNANLRYAKAFDRHDGERRRQYLNDLSEGKAKMNAKNLFPYEIYTEYIGLEREDPSLEAMWKNLKDIGDIGSTMVVVDGSFSMRTLVGQGWTSAIDVSRSMGIYFAERCKGEYKDKVIEFAHNPQFIDLSGCGSLFEKQSEIESHCANHGNTNIEMVFDIILDTALRNGIPQEEIPERVLIISDMEFDRAARMDWLPHETAMSRLNTLFEEISKRWEDNGYRMPGLSFWNVSSRSNTIPVGMNECGATLISGFSPNAIRIAMSGQSPIEALMSAIESKRYDPVEEALAK